MKNKILTLFILLSLLVLASCSDPYNENDAKILIKARVPKCVNIIKVDDQNNGHSHYAAVDSTYRIYTFDITSSGSVRQNGSITISASLLLRGYKTEKLFW